MPSARLATQADISILGQRITSVVMAAVYRGLDETADLGVKHAKRLAPVRKVSYIERPAIPRDLSRAEIRAGVRGSRGAARLKTTLRRSKQYVEAPEIVADRTGVIFHTKNPDDASFISGRGRGELRRGLRPGGAIYRREVQEVRRTQFKDSQGRIVTRKNIIRREVATLGGRLRAEIRKQVISEGPIFRIDIVSPTEYARFVEFPTTRTAAQPYLRPTLEYLKRPLVDKMRRSLERL